MTRTSTSDPGTNDSVIFTISTSSGSPSSSHVIGIAPYVKISPSGVKYVDASSLSASEKGKLISTAFNNGKNPIPVITDPSVSLDVQNIADATLKLKDMKSAFDGVATDSAAARDSYYAAAITMAAKLQTDPNAAGTDIYQDAALDILKAMSGTKGFRGGTAMVEQVRSTFPQRTDTQPVIDTKIANMQKLINDRQTGLIGSPSAGDQHIIDAKNAESDLTDSINSVKITNPQMYTQASTMFTSTNPLTGQPYEPSDILQAFPELGPKN